MPLPSAGVDTQFALMGVLADYFPVGGLPRTGTDGVTVIPLQPDTLSQLGGGLDVVSHGTRLAVRASEIQSPQSGDAFAIDGVTYVVQGTPRYTSNRLVWELDVYEK